MNSRQRVLSALRHVEPDGVPVDLGATPSSGISAIAYHNLLHHLPLQDRRNWVYDVVQQVAQPSEEVLDLFRIDTLDLGRTFNTQESDWVDYTLPNGGIAQMPAWFRSVKQANGSRLAYKREEPPPYPPPFAPREERGPKMGEEAIAVMPAAGFSYDQIVYPFLDGYPQEYGANLDQAMGRIHWAALAHSPWDHAGEPDFWKQLRLNALHLRLADERAVVLSAGCNLFEWGTFLRRLDNFIMDLKRAPADVERFLDALLLRHLASLEKICREVGELVDVIRLGDDLGMNTGPLMSPQTYRQLFKPRHKILCDYIKAHSNMHILLHSCGSIYKLIPDLIEAGFEILNPVQTSARDMQPENLKKEFGRDVTFWGGGADTRMVLNMRKPGAVKEHVRYNIETLAPGGGFIFNPIHNILPDVPPENIVAMFEAVDEYR